MHRGRKRAALTLGSLLLLFPLTVWGQGKFTLSGFVDASFFYENLRETNTFTLEEVELDVQAELTPWAGLRTDLNFRGTDRLGTDVVDFGDLSADEILEQGYLYLVLPKDWGLPFEGTFRFGKFNAPVGWELLDPPDLYQFSRGQPFNFGLPFNVTGAFLALTFNPIVDLQLYVVNGWDLLQDNNNMKTFGGRLGITPIPDVNVGFSLITGPELADNDDDYRTVFDTDLTIKLIAGLVIGAEFQYGWEENVAAGGGDAEWLAGLVTLHYDFTDIIGLTFRFDIFDDQDGSRLPNDNPAISRQTTYALTLAPTFALAKGVLVRAEFKYTKADENVFQKDGGGFTDDAFSAALEFVYSFKSEFEIAVKQ